MKNLMKAAVVLFTVLFLLSACGHSNAGNGNQYSGGNQITATTARPQTNGSGMIIGVVYCPVSFQRNDYDHTKDNVGVIAYHVTQYPVTFGSSLRTKTATGGTLIFSSPCLYTEDPINFTNIFWQSA